MSHAGVQADSTGGQRGAAVSFATKEEAITYIGLLRHTVFVGLREDKPAREVRRETPRAP